ncbi:pantoate--beta-alanine ligase [soil metagenome]
MQFLRTITEFQTARRSLDRLALVPTMGALHDGHLSLMRQGKQHAPHVAVSIFVNPTQFGPKEDFTKYPRPLETDLEMCRSVGVDLVFAPSVEEMYPPDSPQVSIDLPAITTVLEGAHRPGHFAGVCQVVAKLFNIVQPDVALFGRKDFQQLAVLSAMVKGLDFPIDMIGCPIVREDGGLAMSSRNRYLSTDERTRALAISRSLFFARDQVKAGNCDATSLVKNMRGQLEEQHMSVDYVAAAHPKTLAPIGQISGPVVFLIAARVGTTRLIDNLQVDG